MSYEILIQPTAVRDLRKLPREVRKRIGRKLDELANEPRPADAKLLKGNEGFSRVRVGDYRIVYTIREKILVVLVVRIGHRKDIYRNL
ncbi:MAG: type II toxin-antitoxin system RelE/ParE family toxin [Deltaproteobacteria bacterium]|nr:type II toxin-antitoxin system RelE/ParE family toxin [Deltaproteobacteria bacterium]